jgi:hypothetical protein
MAETEQMDRRERIGGSLSFYQGKAVTQEWIE